MEFNEFHWGRYFAKIQKQTLRDSGTGVFLWVLRKFSRTPFLQKKDKDTPFCRVSSSIYDQNNWNVSLKKFNFNKAADLFVRDLPVAASMEIKTDTLFKIMIKEKCKVHLVKWKNNANNETKPSKA